MRGLVILTMAGLVSGCMSNRLSPLDLPADAPAAPEGTVVLTEAVDPLLVGDRLMEAGEYQLALGAYTRAAVDQGMTPDILLSIGSANLRLGRIGQAEDQFRQILAVEPEHVGALNNLGVVLMEQGEYGEARSMFERAFALDSGASDSIRDNLMQAIARMENSVYTGPNENTDLGLIRQGQGVYSLEQIP
jgi:tetratricopeptide (TPR) repeat protein